MKKFILTSVLAVLAAMTVVRAQNMPQEYLGLPGDNLNLYAVMKLFQESETLEDFERNLNDENSRINNLDLNGDNLVDYITVNDFVDGDDHTIVLRVAMNRYDYQDVAVFTVQRFRNGTVQVQLIGDEDLYGKNYIIEPYYADNYSETPNPGYYGNTNNVTVVRTTYYEVAEWPLIVYIYRPHYVAWHSAWYWGYWPGWWSPWRPYYWHYYYGYHYHWHNHYYAHYHHGHHPRYHHYQDYYCNNIRMHSPYVSKAIKEGNYKHTYSRPDQRRDGEELYARTQSRHNERPSVYGSGTGQSRRSTSTSTSTSRSSRSSSTSVSQGQRRSSEVTNPQARSNESRSSQSRSYEVRSSQGRSVEARSSNSSQGRSSEARSSHSSQGRTGEARSSNSSQGRNVEARGSNSSQGRSSEARSSNSSQGRSVEARSSNSSQSRSSETRSSNSSQGRSSETRSSNSSQGRSSESKPAVKKSASEREDNNRRTAPR